MDNKEFREYLQKQKPSPDPCLIDLLVQDYDDKLFDALEVRLLRNDKYDLFCFDDKVRGWVPLWFPTWHWSEADKKDDSQLRALTEKERADLFHRWLERKLENINMEQNSLEENAMHIFYALEEIYEDCKDPNIYEEMAESLYGKEGRIHP